MQNELRKNKYLGFRIGFNDYVKTIEMAQRSGVSITDFILSILLPKINNTDVKQNINQLTSSTVNDKMSEQVLSAAQKRLSEIKNLKN